MALRNALYKFYTYLLTYFCDDKGLGEIPVDSSPTGSPNTRAVRKFYDFRQMTRYITKVVHERQRQCL